MADDKKPDDKKPDDKKELTEDEKMKLAADEPGTSKLGHFVLKYHTFLSSFVIGAAGLVATSIWQYRQSVTARNSAEAAQKVAETQAENSWKIERAEILAKNLQVLASSGPNTAEQRYGVLLSLARGNILDPELSVSYALELGKDNPDYMASVLANTTGKDYQRLVRSFVVTCETKYGLTRLVPICAGDKLQPRSAAIADLITDETQAAISAGTPGPMVMFKDERQVQRDVQRLAALFEPTLTDYYERRMWDDIAKFERFSPGAHLVASLDLAAARTGEFTTNDEQKVLEKFHDDQTLWLDNYLMSPACDAECKGKMLEVMVSHYAESQGDYDKAMRALLESPHALSGNAVSRLHARLLWCQVDNTDLFPLRDNVLVPATAEELAKPGVDPAIVEDLVGLLALVNEPGAIDGNAAAAWKALDGALQKSKWAKIYRERKETAVRERETPPPAMKKVIFCNAPAPAPVHEDQPPR